MEMGVKLFLLASFILISAFFSASETAFLSMNRVKVKRLLDGHVPGAELLHKLKAAQQKTLVTILVANDLFQFAAGSVTASIALEFFPGELGIAVSAGVITFLVLVFSDITPKSLALKYSSQIALRSAPVLYYMSIILSPVIFGLSAISGVFSRMFGVSEDVQRLTEEEVKVAAAISAEEGSILAEEKEMIHRIFQLNDITVGRVMTPRDQIIAFRASTRIRDIPSAALREHPRFPVYRRGLDDIVGVFYLRDFMGNAVGLSGNFEVGKLVRKPLFVYEGRKLDSLLKDFRAKKTQFAVVVDSKGDTVGIVTVEDVLGEIVGEIRES